MRVRIRKRREQKGRGTWKRKLAGLIKFLIVGPDQGQTREWERGGVSLSPHTLEALVAKQMAQDIFKPLFNTVTFFACLLFLPLVKSPTSCHCLKENVRGLWLSVHLLSSGGREEEGDTWGPQPAVVLAAGLVKSRRVGHSAK